MGKKYLLWLDILGFEGLTEIIVEKTHLTGRKVRTDFINVIKEGVEAIEARGDIIGKNYGESDDWILLTDSLDLIFKNVFKILDHNTGYEDYEKIPLEIAVGVGKYDRWARFDGTRLIVEKPTLEFLKTKIIGYYHEWYRKNHNNKSPSSTFIVLTKSAYHELEPLDKKICKKIEYRYQKSRKREEVVTFYVADIEKIKQRGKVFEFLDKIKRSRSKLYDRIDELYVLPLEYKEIKRALKTDRIVFITGTAEYGKTYTAVRLLWEYFNKGYEPIWIKGGEEWERRDARKRLEEMETELKPHHIIYFEDPFGKTRYECMENLEREIGSIIECIKNVEHAYVIITSREEVFKEFKKEHLSSVELKKFEKKLNIKKPSYNPEKRKEILLRWAESKNCKWLENENLKKIVLVFLEDERKLPTPLSIKDFVISSITITEVDKLIEKIEEKSKETARGFAKEIKNMTDDKILFLSFPFVYGFPTNFVRVEYEKLIKELKLKTEEPWNFDRIFNWFKDDKVAVSDGRLVFSHSSYFEALEYLLVERGQLTRINKDIFSRLLFKLSEKDEAAGGVAWAVAYNFDGLPENVRKLLFKLSEKHSTAWGVARAVAHHFDRLPENVRNELLVKLSEKDKTAGDVARAVAYHFDEVPEKARNELLVWLSEKDEAAEDVARAVAYHFDGLPENVRKLLVRLSEKSEAANTVAWTVGHHFDRLDEKVRNELLVKLSDKSEAANTVASIVEYHFDRLPEKVRNELLVKLSEKDKTAGDVARTVAHNFNKLPENVGKLLFKLSEKHSTAWGVARAVAYNFDKLPEKVRKLLFKLSEKDEAAWAVAWAVAHHFDELPEKVKKILDKSQDHFQQMLIDLLDSHYYSLKIEAIKVISKAESKLDKGFTFAILSRLIEDRNEEVKTKAQELMISITEAAE